MDSANKSIPMQTFNRLPGYYGLLAKLDEQQVQNVSAKTIAEVMGLNEIVVRKDLAAVSASGGKPRMGFSVKELMHCIGECLGYYNVTDAILVGVGQLGRSLLSYSGFTEYGVKILAAFDNDPRVIGFEKAGKPVMSMDALPKFCRRLNVRMGIITVPEKQAQAVCDIMVACGILAIWNFAPTHLSVPANVFVHNENMALSLSLLSKHLEEMDRR